MNAEIIYLHLKPHRLLANLPKESIYKIIDEISIKRKKKNEIIDPSRNAIGQLYLVVKGRLKVQNINEEGHEITKKIVRDGDFFGNLLGSDTNPYDYGTVVSDELVYFTISLERFEQLSLEIPQIGINLAKELSRQLKLQEEKYARLVSHDVQTRLIDFFKDWATEEGEYNGNRVQLRNYLTHNDIANLISTCRQTVTSILNRLKDRGNILYSRSQIVIPSIERLHEDN